jgi:hypothetical protein
MPVTFAGRPEANYRKCTGAQQLVLEVMTSTPSAAMTRKLVPRLDGAPRDSAAP